MNPMELSGCNYANEGVATFPFAPKRSLSQMFSSGSSPSPAHSVPGQSEKTSRFRPAVQGKFSHPTGLVISSSPFSGSNLKFSSRSRRCSHLNMHLSRSFRALSLLLTVGFFLSCSLNSPVEAQGAPGTPTTPTALPNVSSPSPTISAESFVLVGGKNGSPTQSASSSSVSEPVKQKRSISPSTYEWSQPFDQRLPVKQATTNDQPWGEETQAEQVHLSASADASPSISHEETNAAGLTVRSARREMRQMDDLNALINLINNQVTQMDEQSPSSAQERTAGLAVIRQPFSSMPLSVRRTSDQLRRKGLFRPRHLAGQGGQLESDYTNRALANLLAGPHSGKPKLAPNGMPRYLWPVVSLLHDAKLLSNLSRLAGNSQRPLTKSLSLLDTMPGDSDENDAMLDTDGAPTGHFYAKRTGEPFRNSVAKRKLIVDSLNGHRMVIDPNRGDKFPGQEGFKERDPSPAHNRSRPKGSSYQRRYGVNQATSVLNQGDVNTNTTNNSRRSSSSRDGYYGNSGHRAASGHSYYKPQQQQQYNTPKLDTATKTRPQVVGNKWIGGVSEAEREATETARRLREAEERLAKEREWTQRLSESRGKTYGFVVNRGHRAANGKKLYDVPQVGKSTVDLLSFFL